MLAFLFYVQDVQGNHGSTRRGWRAAVVTPPALPEDWGMICRYCGRCRGLSFEPLFTTQKLQN
jgi:hypothetical protein